MAVIRRCQLVLQDTQRHYGASPCAVGLGSQVRLHLAIAGAKGTACNVHSCRHPLP
jgi:hypothetical protein